MPARMIATKAYIRFRAMSVKKGALARISKPAFMLNVSRASESLNLLAMSCGLLAI